MKRAIAWFAMNHVAANLIMLLLIVGGLSALPAIHQKIFPDINIEVVSIGVPYLGAAPEEVEEGVCVRIEEEIQGIEGIEEIHSSAAEGACGVSAELISGYPVDRALAEIKNAVDGITTLPEETEKPTVSHVSFRRNALKLALSGDVSEKTLKILGERIRDRISALPGVTQVDLSNARNYEISIELPEESLRRYGLTFNQVVRAVRRSSLDRPGGSIKTSSGEVLLRTKGQAYTGEEFERIVVHTRADGTRLLLGEVARVVDGFEDDDRWALFDDEPAVLIQVYRVGEQRVLDLVERVKAYVDGAEARLPEGVKLTVWQNRSQALRDRLDILIRNGVSGFILVFATLALFLRLRLAFWVSISVPLSFLGALWLFPLFEISIDVISLFAFITVLGLLVDDAIVVGENVHRHQERAEKPLEAAIRGAQEVSVPVIFGVLTTMAAFLPLVLSPGEMGQVFGAIGIVAIACLFFSLVESQLVLPAHLGHIRPRESRAEQGDGGARVVSRWGGIRQRWERIQTFTAGSLERLAQERYRALLERALVWRYSTLAGGVVLLMLTLALLATGHMRFTFFPPIESDYVTASVTLSQGIPVEATIAAVRELEASARRMKAGLDEEFDVDGESVVKHMLTSVGEQPSSTRRGAVDLGSPVGGSHLGEVSIELQGGDVRPIAAREVAHLWREATPPIPDVEELTFRSALFSAGDPIDIQLRSSDVDLLRQASDRLKDHLAEYPGVFDVADSFRDGKEEIKLSILPAAETLGLTLDDLADQVRHAFYGAEAQRIQRGRDDVRVMVRYPKSQRRSLADLDELRIRTSQGAEVPFYAVARAERGRGYATIKRSNRQRVINVTADVDDTRANANQILAELRAGFIPKLLVDFPGLAYELEGEQQRQEETLGALVRHFGFALVLIYALLAVPLRSYGQPLIIMAVIPFGLVGAIGGHLIISFLRWAHVLSGPWMDLSMMSVFGVVALSGVVVNSSLVLVHYINQRRSEGLPLLEAVREAGVARFRPIVLTSITTFAGLAPLITEGSISAQFLIPMATSLGFGVVFATAISLFLVPSSYVILEDIKRERGRC
ncbi:MAG: efflux RND transporter permease subunit [Deltaproteobacteria bacterium]|nr:efflux RND transporter permease subunit [Deltaproteobacteria bacterium]